MSKLKAAPKARQEADAAPTDRRPLAPVVPMASRASMTEGFSLHLARPAKGWSGKLLARFLLPTTHGRLTIPGLHELFGSEHRPAADTTVAKVTTVAARVTPAGSEALSPLSPLSLMTVDSAGGDSSRSATPVTSVAPASPAATVAAVDPVAPVPSDSIADGDADLEPADTAGMHVFAMEPFAVKQGGMVGAYNVGFWPAELGTVRSAAYDNPDGFIEVTPENQDTYVSEHFRLRDFVTHDSAQANVWPKVIVLHEELLDKLELVLADLQAHGIPAEHVVVLSGFRAPQYNEALGDESGRSLVSRHQYGDAADIIIDSNGDGRMDDLNHDGRVDRKDIQLILDAVNRVERAHPDLVGGVGMYHAIGEHGPFAHIDVRGSVARWSTFRGARPLACTVSHRTGHRVCRPTGRQFPHAHPKPAAHRPTHARPSSPAHTNN